MLLKHWSALMLAVAACATLALPARGHAQASAIEAATADCPFEEHAPKPVLEAGILIVEAINAKTDSAKRMALREAGRVLSNVSASGSLGDKARAWQTGRLLMLWLGLDKQPVVTTRGALGFIGDSAEPIDLSIWIDSTFSAVEAVVPSCVPATTALRQYPGWVALVQRAVRQANSGKFDSAAVTVSQASRIYAKHPYTAFVIAQVAESRGEHRTAIAQYQDAIELSAQDSAYGPVRRSAEAAMGALGLDAARVEQNPGLRAFYMAAATDAYVLLAKESGATYDQVLTAGVLVGQAHRTLEAIQLFRRAVDLNPYQRDALSDLATVLVGADSARSARPFIDRLLTVDPSNPSNYGLAEQTYSVLQRQATLAATHDADEAAALAAAAAPADIAKRRAYQDSSAAWADSAAAFGAKAIGLLNQKDAIVVDVQFNRWAVKDGSVTLGGIVTNAATAPKTVVMHVDFLDRTGNAVSSTEVTLTVDPRRSQEFSLTGAGAGITAFRYAPPS